MFILSVSYAIILQGPKAEYANDVYTAAYDCTCLNRLVSEDAALVLLISCQGKDLAFQATGNYILVMTMNLFSTANPKYLIFKINLN